MNPRTRGLWSLLAAAAGLGAVAVLLPVLLLRPFSPQTPTTLSIAFRLRAWSPWITLVMVVVALGAAGRLWSPSRAWNRLASVALALVAVGSAWLARQNHFEWMFAPLGDPRFAAPAEAGFVGPDEMVLAVDLRGDPVAYPVRQLAYHHLVNDRVGGIPVVATY